MVLSEIYKVRDFKIKPKLAHIVACCLSSALTLTKEHQDPPDQLAGTDEQELVDGCWLGGDLEILIGN